MEEMRALKKECACSSIQANPGTAEQPLLRGEFNDSHPIDYAHALAGDMLMHSNKRA